MKRILLASEDAIIRKGLKETLREEVGDVFFGEARDNRQAIDLAANFRWDMLMLGLNSEYPDGLQLLTDIRKSHPQLPVIVFSPRGVNIGSRAMKLGASGYVSQPSAAGELGDAVRAVLEGGRYINSTLAGQMALELQRDNEHSVHADLSGREHQVMRMIASGKALKEIAAELSLSVKTVGTYHTRILAKMHMKNDIEITRYAILNRLVE